MIFCAAAARRAVECKTSVHGDSWPRIVYGQLWLHSWQVCGTRSARDDLALTSHDRSGYQLDSRRHPKLMEIDENSLIFIEIN